ncbi:MAG: M23 family metallopeptidase [Saprospiraceae bacterium]|nr:M23 family metallopeptidase [Saprospiraceae bacterium]
MMLQISKQSVVYFLWLTLLLVSCKQEIVPIECKPGTDHEDYVHSLEKANLLNTALAKDWLPAAQASLESPVQIQTPYQETFYWAPETPEAQGYIFSVKRGQKILIDLDPQKLDSTQIFMDLFRIEKQSAGDEHVHIASAQKKELILGFEPREDGRYLLRIQPELLRGGQYHFIVKVVPSLQFPVLDKTRQAIGSFFGDERDGGRRKHHGIDIFAKRHTPILAPTDGYIRFAGERGLGGQVVWMHDPKRDLKLYFAHLHTIIAKSGQWVELGDTLGLVGNTGNARTTPPHLHFGIYQDGPIDPFHFVADLPDKPKNIRSNQNLVGQQVRMRQTAAITLTVPDSMKQDEKMLDQYQMIEIKAAMLSNYRVKLPNGIVGVIHMNDVESMERPIMTDRLSEDLILLEKPAKNVAIVEHLVTPEHITVLAKDADHWYVRSITGAAGWIETLP